MKILKSDQQGRIELPVSERRNFAAGAEYVSATSRHLLLRPTSEEGELGLAGTFGEISAADVMSFLNMFRKTGILYIRLPGGEKSIYLQQGEIVAATSTLVKETLGDCLCELGKIDRDVLNRTCAGHNGDQSLSKCLVDAKVAEPKDLWQAARYLVEKIVYDLFARQDEGGFSFVATALPEDDITKLSISTQNMIMEGMRRSDETELFKRRIPSHDMIARVDLDRMAELAGGEAEIARLIAEGGLSVREIVRRAEMGEFEAVRTVYQLIEKNCVQLMDAAPVEVSGVCGEVVQVYNGVLVLLQRRLLEVNVETAREVHAFLRSLPQPYSHVFGDLEPASDGSLDAARLMSNLIGLAEEDRRKLLVDALNELVFMQCLLVRRELPTADAEELTRRVQEITARVKKLIGRNE